MTTPITDEDYGRLLNVDPLALAEKITGQSYKTDHETMMAGFALALNQNKRIKEAAEAADDYHYGIKFPNAVRIAESEGFKEVGRVEFKGKVWNEGDIAPDEVMLFMWHDDGLFLMLESYRGTGEDGSLNMGTVYFNWKCNDQNRPFFPKSSGSCEKVGDEYIHVGNRDVRDGLRYVCRELRSKGTILNDWVTCGWLWLLHYMDTKAEDYNYKQINAERYAKLPEHVRNTMKYID